MGCENVHKQVASRKSAPTYYYLAHMANSGRLPDQGCDIPKSKDLLLDYARKKY
jgi:hypothetical protein